MSRSERAGRLLRLNLIVFTFILQIEPGSKWENRVIYASPFLLSLSTAMHLGKDLNHSVF